MFLSDTHLDQDNIDDSIFFYEIYEIISLDESSVADLSERPGEPEHRRCRDPETALEAKLGDLRVAGDDRWNNQTLMETIFEEFKKHHILGEMAGLRISR